MFSNDGVEREREMKDPSQFYDCMSPLQLLDNCKYNQSACSRAYGILFYQVIVPLQVLANFLVTSRWNILSIRSCQDSGVALQGKFCLITYNTGDLHNPLKYICTP